MEMISALVLAAVVTSLDGGMWKLDGEPVTVPHTWNAADYDQGFADALGRGDFRRKVDSGNSVRRCATLMKVATYTRALPAPQSGRRYFVHFEGACEKAVVRVNGRFVGRHGNGFTPFCFEVTPFLQKGACNQLEVEVDNRYDPEIPPASADFTMCGGLYRTVQLVETAEKGIDPTRPLKLWPDAKTGRVRAEVPRLDGGYVTQVYELGAVELWSPENPKLYDLAIALDGETVMRRVGFKTVEFREDGFYLNGKRRRVRAINRHQDMSGKGWALSPEDDERDFRLIKEMGCDAVRLCHYPQGENVYRLCDELGLLVWSEIPNVDYLTMTENYRQAALQMATEEIEWRGSHVSVAWWSCFNELYSSGPFKGTPPFRSCGTPAYDPAIKLLCEHMKKLDPTRPIVAAGCRRTTSSIMAIPDQIGLNVYPGWYGTETMSDWVKVFLECNPKYRCFALSEYGAGSSVNAHENPVRAFSRIAEPHTEEYQTLVHMTDWRDLSKCEALWGVFIWVWNDFGASDRYEGERRGVNDKGVVTGDRKTLKDSYYFYKANWNPAPMLHLCSKRMAETTKAVCEAVAFTNLKEPVKVFVNGKSFGEKSADEIASVTFRDLPLEVGRNEIKVTCGDFAESWNIVRR